MSPRLMLVLATAWVLALPARAEEPAPAPAPAVPAAAARPAPPAAAERLELDATAIRGNQELPKVLYIVPWKEPDLTEPAGRPLNSLVDEALAPVDREVFRRQLRYFDQLYAGPGAAVGAAEPGPESR